MSKIDQHQNAQKRIHISPKSSNNKSSNGEDRAQFLMPSASVLIDDLKSADHNRNAHHHGTQLKSPMN